VDGPWCGPVNRNAPVAIWIFAGPQFLSMISAGIGGIRPLNHVIAGPVKKASKSHNQTEPLTTEQLRGIWEKLRCDPDACGALKRLDDAGFRISHLTPNDASFKQPSWADCIAALSLLPNKPTTRRIHRKTAFRKCSRLVRELRVLATTLKSPFSEVRIFSKIDFPVNGLHTLQEDLLKAAMTLEHFFSWDYYVREVNPRNALIADLRWTIRHATGKPHDRDLSILVDAAFRAAGYEDGFYMDPTMLDRIEKRQKEGRVKACQRVRALASTPSPFLPRSTRISQTSRKRV
jgi:hypothetical protein